MIVACGPQHAEKLSQPVVALVAVLTVCKVSTGNPSGCVHTVCFIVDKFSVSVVCFDDSVPCGV